MPHALLGLIEAEIERMGLDPTEAVITVGPPDNFATFVHDLWSVVFSGFSIPVSRPDELRKKPLALISVPETEGSRAAWIPVTCGHELAHFLQFKKPIVYSGINALDRNALAATTGPLPSRPGEPRARVLEQVAANWLVELSCDAFAVHRFGIAAVASLADFLSFASPESAAGATHPPRALRTRLMLDWARRTGDSAPVSVERALEALADQETPLPDWAHQLTDHFWDSRDALWSSISDWCGTKSYGERGRQDVVNIVRDLLAEGVPGAELVDVGSAVVSVEAVDVINAVWSSFDGSGRKAVNKLALKAIDSLDFLVKWRAAGGDSKPLQPQPFEPLGSGALSDLEINARLIASDDSRLVMTPLLADAVGPASVDLRLGNKFIVFERTSSPAFDAVLADRDPRTMQSEVEKAWGDVFYLHPGQMVLAATLEFIVMPKDLTGQVITRSSYGRLGLLSATAVQVHPHFPGCLTLELVNLGEMPVAITPGERIAQLMLWRTTADVKIPEEGERKYSRPTGPEFSKIRRDSESKVLRNLRERFAVRSTSLD